MTAAILAAALGLTGPAAPPPPRRFSLFYGQGLGIFRVTMNSVDALESALRRHAAGARLEHIDPLKGWVSGDEFVFDPASAETPPQDGARRVGDANGLATAKEIVLVEPPQPELLEAVYQGLSDRSDWDHFVPSARKTPLELRRYADGSRSARLAGGRGVEAWNATAGFAYHISVDGKPATVYIVGRVLGGPGVVDALKRRMTAAPQPAFLLNTGWVHAETRYGAPPDLILKTAADLGAKVLAFTPGDLSQDWDVISEYAGKGLKLLCTNLKATSQDSTPVERIHLEELAGTRVAFLSLVGREAKAALRRAGLDYSIEDPVASLQAAVAEARGKDRANLVVLVSHLSPIEEANVLDRLDGGVDLVLDNATEEEIASRRSVRVDLTDWSKERHGPALQPVLANNSFTELNVTMAGDSPVTIVERPGPVEAEPAPAEAKTALAENQSKVLAGYMGRDEAVLPDPRVLWPGKMQYQPPEFWNQAASALRRKAGAEVALLRISNLGSNIPGEVRANYVREWMTPDQHPVLVRLSGDALSKLRERVILPGKPISPDEPQKPYGSEVWLAAAGIDEKGRVSGLPLDGGELYTVATTQELLERSDELPALSPPTPPLPLGKSLTELVLAQFKADRDAAQASTATAGAYLQAVKNEAEGKPPVKLVWRLNLKELAFQFSDTQVNNNADFTQVRDARVQGTSQVLTQGDMNVVSELYWDRFRWDTGLNTAYGQVTLHPQGQPTVVNTTEDQIELSIQLRHRTWALTKDGMRPSLGPFVNIAYDTQFQPTPGLPLAQFLRTRSGLGVSDGTTVKEAYLGPTTETDFSTVNPRTHAGYAAGITAEKPLHGGPTKARFDAWYIELFPNGADQPQDLGRRLEAKLSLSSPLWGGVTVAPFLDFYLFQGLVVRETGTSTIFGVSINFARLWKPFF